MMRGGELAQEYANDLQKFVDRRGGLTGCPIQLRIVATHILIRIAVMIRLAKFKYGAPISDEIVGPLQ